MQERARLNETIFGEDYKQINFEARCVYLVGIGSF
jgi:hypothetical protein